MRTQEDADDRKATKRRKQRATIAACARVSRSDYCGRTATENARKGLLAKYQQQVDPDMQLEPQVREHRAWQAWRADMLRAKLKASSQKGESKLKRNIMGGS